MQKAQKSSCQSILGQVLCGSHVNSLVSLMGHTCQSEQLVDQHLGKLFISHVFWSSGSDNHDPIQDEQIE